MTAESYSATFALNALIRDSYWDRTYGLSTPDTCRGAFAFYRDCWCLALHWSQESWNLSFTLFAGEGRVNSPLNLFSPLTDIPRHALTELEWSNAPLCSPFSLFLLTKQAFQNLQFVVQVPIWIQDHPGLPVLSQAIVVQQPIVSAALNLLTKLLSFNIRFTEYARAIVTAKGSPSGTATTCKTISCRDCLHRQILWESIRMYWKLRKSFSLLPTSPAIKCTRFFQGRFEAEHVVSMLIDHCYIKSFHALMCQVACLSACCAAWLTTMVIAVMRKWR